MILCIETSCDDTSLALFDRDRGIVETLTARDFAGDAGVESIMSKCALAALNEARDTGRAEDMVSQMVDFYAAKFGK